MGNVFATPRDDVRFARRAATATGRASLGPVLVGVAVVDQGARPASLGGTSITVSPATTSCWSLEGNVTAQRFYEAIGFVRLADIGRDDGTALRSYGLTLLPALERR
jgi:hypothetical protein